MKIYIDADGCPVVDITLKTASCFDVEVVIICDTSHLIQRENAETVVVEKGADSVDFKLVNMVKNGDIAVTQDYGLAAMCLAKGAKALNQNGLIFSDRNMDELLLKRHIGREIRRAGGRTKGPAKRTPEQDEAFEKSLVRLIKRGLGENDFTADN